MGVGLSVDAVLGRGTTTVVREGTLDGMPIVAKVGCIEYNELHLLITSWNLPPSGFRGSRRTCAPRPCFGITGARSFHPFFDCQCKAVVIAGPPEHRSIPQAGV
jgi:hypothetical protein